jgi:TRAP-type C4-dicarboxylate transport system permease small subunit
MATVAVLYRRLLELLAIVAGLMLAAMAFAIVLDVVVRNLGLQPPAHTLTLTEYGLLYLTMLAAPWLVREKGHVHIEVVTAALPPRARFWLTRAVYALCVLTCAVIFWFSLKVTIAHYQRSVIDVRSFDMPRWLLTASIPLSFGLMTIEFGRFLLGFDSMHEGQAGLHDESGRSPKVWRPAPDQRRRP